MGIEIERKFLVTGEPWREGGAASSMIQGYLSTDPDRTVRIRVADDGAWMTVKGRSRGAVRSEWEWPLPRDEAAEALEALHVGSIVRKVRHRIPFGGRTWEVDVFSGDNEGLVVAEVELESEDAAVELPPWVDREVTDDERYANASLAVRPWREWGSADGR